LSGASTYSFTGVFNGTWYVILRDSSGASTTKSTLINCTNTTTTTSTTSTTTNAPICTYAGGSATITYTSTTTTSTSTTAAPTTTSTSTSTSTTTLPPTTTTTTTSTSTSTTTTTSAGTAYGVSTAGGTLYDACAYYDNNQTIYGNNTTWLTVTRFYTDSGMTTPFNGSNSWYNEYNASTSYVIQIDTSGYISTTFDCSTL
jgi:hypothetical protein